MDRAPAGMAGPRLVDIAKQSATRMGDSLVELFDHIRTMPGKVRWVQRHITADLAAPIDPTLDRACAAVASAIDEAAAAFDRQPYHNRQHFCEVALTAHVLCLLNRFDTPATQFILLAALLHDFVHDGGAHPPFLQERASVHAAATLLAAAGLDADQVDRLTAMVLSTDVAHGTVFMSSACRSHARGGAGVPAVPAQAPELAPLLADASLACAAQILCEADVLPSIGLGIAHAMRLQAHLSREWGRALDERDKLAFIDGVLAAGIVGDFFRPNVDAMRLTLSRNIDAHDAD